MNLTHTAVAIPAGALSDRIGKEKVLILGYGAFLAASALIPTIPRIILAAYAIAATYGIYIGIVETVQRALVPEYAEPGLRGTAYGVYYLAVGTAFFAANAIVGTLWEVYGPTAASLYSVASSTIAIAAMTIFLKTKKRNN